MQIRSVMAVGLCAVLLAACGDRDRLGVSSSDQGPLFIQDPHTPASTGSNTTTTSKALKKRDGGELTIGRYTVSIPKNGLSSNATVTVTLVNEEFAWLRVTAQSALLTKPLVLKMTNVDETDGSRMPSLKWYASSNGTWLPLSTTRNGWELSASSSSLAEFRVGSAAQPGVQWIRWLVGPGYETEWIEANKGGDVAFGRFKVNIPARALAQNTYITVREPGSGYVECHLEPHGLQFLAEVELITDLNGLDRGYDDWTTWWLNEDVSSWEDQGGVFDGGKVRSSIWHFSTYRPGRAGW